jgi:hypothetical protein
MLIDGWARGSHTWSLIDKPIQASCVSLESQRKWSEVNVAKQGDDIVLRTRIKFETSGDFDCRIRFHRREILLMALEALRDVPVGQVADLLSSNEAAMQGDV